MKREERKTERGLGLGLSIVAFQIFAYGLALVMQLNQQIFTARASHAVAGVGLQVLGIVFVASYYFEHKSFLFRGLMWFCENIPDFGNDDYFLKPKGRGMAFFYCILLFGLGSASVAGWPRIR